jgi:hypothetical protein
MKHVKTISVQLQKHAAIFIIAAVICITQASAQQKLKAFEGYYQFADDENTFLQITAKGDSLILKQLWDQKEFPFHQTAVLEFYCDAQSFPLKFKDSAGSIVQVLAFNKDVWIKVKNYNPPVHKEIQLTPSQLQAFEGEYKMQGGDADDVLQISYKGNSLVLKQLWDGQEISFKPESPLDFYCKERSFPLKFIKDKNGNVTQVLAFNRDVWIKTK